MRLKPISALMAATLLILASLACNTITGGGLPNPQATVNAALTAASFGGFAATAESVKATADALLNSAGEETATPKPTEAGVTPPDATETPAGVATVDTGFGGEAPDDVPIIDGQNSNLFTSAEIVSYQTDADYKTVVSFYKDGMAKNGWTIDTNSSVEQETTTILYCTKDNRQATVTISPDTNAKTTTVLILIAAN
jgi:hypothetical protein